MKIDKCTIDVITMNHEGSSNNFENLAPNDDLMNETNLHSNGKLKYVHRGSTVFQNTTSSSNNSCGALCFEFQQGNLWSSILDSVSSSKCVPSKKVLLLGEPSTGKSTLAAALLQKNVEIKDEKYDFALGYDWTMVKDDGDEGAIFVSHLRKCASSYQFNVDV